MKRLLAAVVLASMLAFGASAVQADDQGPGGTGVYGTDIDRYEDAFTNPLRLMYYVAHPIGFAAEWLVFRPLHYLISRPYIDRVFGYVPLNEESSYRRLGERM